METEPKRHKAEECGQNFHLDALFTRNILSSLSPQYVIITWIWVCSFITLCLYVNIMITLLLKTTERCGNSCEIVSNVNLY